MKFTLSWLRDHLDTAAPLEALAARLSAIGLEVEDIDDPATRLGAFVVARVLEARPHPNADRLKVCRVETARGGPAVEVVCGAPNARAGMIGVFAPVGSHIPGTGITLEARPVRGVVSNGMLLSERELELSDEHTGIIELSPDAKVGSPAAKALGLDDAVIEIAITPNRPDCLGVRGIARDLVAAGLGKLKPDPLKPVKGSFSNPVPIKLDFDKETASACPVFAGRVIKGVKNGPSPEWLQRRLKAIGLRPINALVDITNYISYDRGRPLHVYDADRLKGAIRARLGRKGESFKALDGKIYEVDSDMCVIADDNGVLGLGGVIGGEETGSTDTTTNVFIESAYFDPKRTARTGRKLNIQSDARFRFERGVDPNFVVPGLELATLLVLDICGGEASKAEIAGKPPKPNAPFAFDPKLVRKLSGLELKGGEIKKLLTALGIELKGNAPKLKAAPPSWRPDIMVPVDLVEERGQSGRHHVDHVLTQRFGRPEVLSAANRGVGPPDIPAVRARELPERRSRVVHDLAPQVLLDVLAADVDRRRRADVRRRGHREDVAGLADPDARRRGPGSRRRDVDDHRNRGGQHALHHLTH